MTGARETLLLTLPSTALTVGPVRRTVRTFLSERGVPRATIDAILVAVSEAMTNVVLHAYDRLAPDGVVSVELALDDDLVRLTVTDAGCGIAPRDDSPGAGLGLAIIAGLAARLEIGAAGDGCGTQLRASFPFTAAGTQQHATHP